MFEFCTHNQKTTAGVSKQLEYKDKTTRSKVGDYKIMFEKINLNTKIRVIVGKWNNFLRHIELIEAQKV